MKQLLNLGRYASMLAAVVFAASTMFSCENTPPDDGGETPAQKNPPADAGSIQGETEIPYDAASITLTIAEIERAETYKWYKDGTEVQNSADRTLAVTAAGVYKVAGINADGEGKASPDHTVTKQADPGPQLPDAAGNITGPTVLVEGQSIELEIPEIERAETYRWYKDNAEVQNTADRTLTVTEAGAYKVAGVNEKGEGTPSPVRNVTLLGAPAVAGTIEGATECEWASRIYLSIGEIDGAETYRWYYAPAATPDTYAKVQNTTSRTLGIGAAESGQVGTTFDAAGNYKVAGVNEAGEGVSSPVHTVIMTGLAPEATPSITVGDEEYVYAGNEAPSFTKTLPVVVTCAVAERATKYKFAFLGSDEWGPIQITVQETESRSYTITQAGTYFLYCVNPKGQSLARRFTIVEQ